RARRQRARSSVDLRASELDRLAALARIDKPASAVIKNLESGFGRFLRSEDQVAVRTNHDRTGAAELVALATLKGENGCHRCLHRAVRGLSPAVKLASCCAFARNALPRLAPSPPE